MLVRWQSIISVFRSVATSRHTISTRPQKMKPTRPSCLLLCALTLWLSLVSTNAEINNHLGRTSLKASFSDHRRQQRGAAAAKPKRQTPVATKPAAHHAGELMTAPTAIANVLADLCPHGMLPIGMYCLFPVNHRDSMSA
jgi:hypothetical protein